MNTTMKSPGTNKSTTGIDPRVKLSLLWIFVVLLMVYADIVSLLDPTSPIREVMAGAPLPAGGLLAGAILMDNFNFHGYAVLGIELQSKSLGNHHHWCIHDCTYRYRRARFVLCVV